MVDFISQLIIVVLLAASSSCGPFQSHPESHHHSDSPLLLDVLDPYLFLVRLFHPTPFLVSSPTFFSCGSFRPYKEYNGPNNDLNELTTKNRPIGFSRFPAEIMSVCPRGLRESIDLANRGNLPRHFPRSWLENSWNLTYYKEHARGGHFASVDNPSAFVADVRATVSLVDPCGLDCV